MRKLYMREPRTWVAAALVLLVPIVGCDEPVEPEPVPTTVEITPEMVELLSAGSQTGLNAVVRDQEGTAMPNASVTWTSSDPAVFTIEGNGLIATVTAVANGEAMVTATAGQANGTASVTVIQTPARMEVVSGNDQEALRNTPLPQPLVVRVVELTGGGVPGVVINFATVDEGSGSVSPAEATTGADGTASTMWTLGGARRQRATASVADPELVAGFHATATADPPMPDYTIAGDIESSRFDPLDSETIEITAHIANLGDGSTQGPWPLQITLDGMPLETIDVDPVQPGDTVPATITAGPFEAGDRRVEVAIDPNGEIEEWEESNNEGDTLLFVRHQRVIAVGDSLAVGGPTGSVQVFRFDVEEQVNQTLTVRLRGPSGDGDLFVDFNLYRPSSLVRERWKRRCYSWNVGTIDACQFYPVREGTYYILVHAYEAFEDATLTVTIGEAAQDPFDIELVMVDQGTASQNAIIRQVEQRYESMIGVGEFDFSGLSADADACAPGMPELNNLEVDDISIYLMIGPLDGVGNAVAMSGVCFDVVRRTRSGWVGMPGLGAVVLDEADIAQLESDGVLEAVVTREIALAMGFSPTAWDFHGFLRNPSLTDPPEPDADTHLNAPLVVAAFNAAGGEGYAGAKVPLENGAIPGISDVHWRASVFGDEVMTPYITGDSQPLSRITLEALYEVGYEIDVMMADAFTLAGARLARPRGPKMYLGIDLAAYRGPVATVEVGGVVQKNMKKE